MAILAVVAALRMSAWFVVTAVTTTVDGTVHASVVETEGRGTVTIFTGIRGCTVTRRLLVTSATSTGNTGMIKSCPDKTGGVMTVFANI